jgi:predicted nucleotidyltransferase
MGTTSGDDMLSAALFGKGRRAILALFYTRVDEAFYLRQVARVTGVGLGAVQRELQQLSRAGIITRTVRGRQVYYQANPTCPIFSELKSLIVKTAGIADVLRTALAILSDRIDIAFIYGSVARGTEIRTSDIDLLVIGDATFGDVVSALGPGQDMLGREINPTVYPKAEFKAKAKAGQHFLRAVMKGPKIFLVGDESELARLAGKRLAD